MGNARQRGIEHSINREDIIELPLASEGRCAITGIPFDFSTKNIFSSTLRKRSSTSKRRPWVASLDRVDPFKGYRPDNVRLICFAVNAAMNLWGENALYKIVEAINLKRSGMVIDSIYEFDRRVRLRRPIRKMRRRGHLP